MLGVTVNVGLELHTFIGFLGDSNGVIIFILNKLTNIIPINNVSAPFFAYLQSVFSFWLIVYGIAP